MLRLATLAAFVVAVGMIRTHLTREGAWILVGVGAAIALVGLAAHAAIRSSVDVGATSWIRGTSACSSTGRSTTIALVAPAARESATNRG